MGRLIVSAQMTLDGVMSFQSNSAWLEASWGGTKKAETPAMSFTYRSPRRPVRRVRILTPGTGRRELFKVIQFPLQWEESEGTVTLKLEARRVTRQQR